MGVMVAESQRSFTDFSSSASSKKQDRASNTSTTPSQLKLRLNQNRMSPNSRTSEWLHKTETPSKSSDSSLSPEVKDSKITKPAVSRAFDIGNDRKISRPAASRPPSAGKDRKITKPAVSRPLGARKGRASKAKTKSWISRLWSYLGFKKHDDKSNHDKPLEDVDFEGATLIGESSPPQPIFEEEKAPAKILALEGIKGITAMMSDESTTSSNSKVTKSKEAEVDDADIYRGWTDDEVWLFEKLDWRGYEPLLPKHWDRDFLTMYNLLFTNDNSIAFVKSASGKDYHGKLISIAHCNNHANDLIQQSKRSVASSSLVGTSATKFCMASPPKRHFNAR